MKLQAVEWKKLLCLLFLLSLPVVITFVGFELWKRSSHQELPRHTSLRAEQELEAADNYETPTVLFWTLFFRNPWPVQEGIRHCGSYKCNFTQNRENFHNSRAVIFHFGAIRFLPDVLHAASLKRLPNQWWIYMNGEPPLHNRIYPFLRNYPVFNWTMTYKVDSDIGGTYAVITPGVFRDGFDPKRNYLEGKTIEVSAMVSDCVYGRMRAIRALMKHINVNLRGKCNGNMAADGHSLIRKSKFYLAFENTLCVDYVTEKTYKNAYQNEAVPIILSGANLSNPQIVPPGSYIDASKFKSAKELADYLKYVGGNKEVYNKFFEWRNKWDVHITTWTSLLCGVCKKIHESDPLLHPKVYTSDLSGVYVKEKECTSYIKWN